MKLIVMFVPQDSWRTETRDNGSLVKLWAKASKRALPSEVASVEMEEVSADHDNWLFAAIDSERVLCLHSNSAPNEESWSALKEATSRSGVSAPDVAIAFHPTGFVQGGSPSLGNAVREVFCVTGVVCAGYSREPDVPVWAKFCSCMAAIGKQDAKEAKSQFDSLFKAVEAAMPLPRFSLLKHRIVNLLQPLALDMQRLHDIAKPVLMCDATGSGDKGDMSGPARRADEYLRKMPRDKYRDALHKVWFILAKCTTGKCEDDEVTRRQLLADGQTLTALVEAAVRKDDNDLRAVLRHAGLKKDGEPCPDSAVGQFHNRIEQLKLDDGCAEQLLFEEREVFESVDGEDFYGWFNTLVDLLEQLQLKVERHLSSQSTKK